MSTDRVSRGQTGGNTLIRTADQEARDDIYSDDPHRESHEASHEEAPLLPNDLPPDVMPKKSFQRLVLIMGTIALVVLTASQSILSPASQEILEDIICRKEYPDHQIGVFDAIDSRCKGNKVQKTLTMVHTWNAAAELCVPIIVQLPYGVIADKYGRRIVLFLAIFGVALLVTWQLFVLSFPDRFNVWSILYGNIALLIGGGGQVAVAMVFTIFSDVVPAAQRTLVFYQIIGALRIVAVAVTPAAAALLNIDPWLAIWVAYGLLIFGTICTLLIPETLTLRQKADDIMRADGVAESTGDDLPKLAKKITVGTLVHQAVFSVRNDMTHIWRFLLSSKGIMLLIISMGVYFPVTQAFLIDLLQYMTKRFNWTWATATYVLSIENFAAVVVLMVILPAVSWLLTRSGYTPLYRDLILVRFSAAFTFVGMAVLAIAPHGAICVIGLVLYSFGAGFAALFRGLICALVEPHTLGTLNTAIATTENVMGLISTPILGWLLYKGMELGGVWIGLTFMVAAALAGVVTIIMFVFKLPRGFERA